MAIMKISKIFVPGSNPGVPAYLKSMPRKKINSIPINDIILFALYSTSSGRESSFQKLVKECFQNFPHIFSLQNFSQWPDSRKLDRPLRTLRKKQLIKGNPKTFFSLTKNGKKRAIEIAKILKQGKLL